MKNNKPQIGDLVIWKKSSRIWYISNVKVDKGCKVLSLNKLNKTLTHIVSYHLLCLLYNSPDKVRIQSVQR